MIGTSIGLAYEDVFQHAAGVPHDYNVIDPDTTPDINTNDKNEVTPKSKPVVTEVQDKMPFPDNHNPDQDFAARFGNLPPSGILNDIKRPSDRPLIRKISDTVDEQGQPAQPSVMDKLLGTNGAERYQTWPEKVLRGLIPDDIIEGVGNIASGKTPMWAMDPESGEFHTSPEGIHQGLGMALMSSYGSAAGTDIARSRLSSSLPVTVHLRGEAHDALQEGPDVFQQFMATRSRAQSSNIVEHPVEPVQPAAPISMEQTPFEPHYPAVSQFPEQDARMGFTNRTDHMSDHEFYNYGAHQEPGAMTAEQEARWERIDREPATRPRFSDDTWQEPEGYNANGHDYHGSEEDVNEQAVRHVKAQFEDPDAEITQKGPLKLLKDENTYNPHSYKFMSDNGVPGELRLTPRNNGKDLYVNWIGTIAGNGANEVGKAEMKNLFKALAERYPNAESISGFRVSGARTGSGRGSMDATMRIPGRGPKYNAEAHSDWRSSRE